MEAIASSMARRATAMPAVMLANPATALTVDMATESSDLPNPSNEPVAALPSRAARPAARATSR